MSILQSVITIICAVFASGGFWAFMQNRRDKKDHKTDLLIGIAHDRIIWLGMQYIERGYITSDEYENLVDYLFKPYEALGGNGSAKKVVDEVRKLPMTHGPVEVTPITKPRAAKA